MKVDITVFSLFFLNVLHKIGSGAAHKCFVCGPDSAKFEDIIEIKRHFPNMKHHEVPLCSKYRNHNREAFVKECPVSSYGCLTKIEGGSIIRTCAPVSIDDCKIANGVTYCYCSSEKCNTPDRRLSDPAPQTQHSGHAARGHAASVRGHVASARGHAAAALTSDDEDTTEGSAWPTFYYDNYYDDNYDLGYGDPGDYSDVTDPPPFVQEELEEEYELQNSAGKHKHDREKTRENEIFIVEDKEEGRRRPEGENSAERSSWSVMVLLLCGFITIL